jgi:hypothetical protein
MSDIKIQINSLEALERLIGGDSQLEMDIRNSVVQEFTKRHLKSLTLTETGDKIGVLVKRAVEAEIEKFIKRERYDSKVAVKDEGLKAAIVKEVHDTISQYVSKAIESQKANINDMVKDRVEDEVGTIVKRYMAAQAEVIKASLLVTWQKAVKAEGS